MATASKPRWLQSLVKGVLLDITGVLYNTSSDGTHVITGSLQAIQRLKDSSIPVRLCTNESQLSREKISERLTSLGFPVKLEEVFSPIPAAKKILRQQNQRPYLIVHKNAVDAFNDIVQENPNCVLIGDAGDNFSYENLDKAFRVLQKTPVLYTMGYGKFYKENDVLVLDVGPYSKLLEFATGVTPVIIGKPSTDYFNVAVKDMGLNPSEVVMVGDDIIGDVKGAMDCGIRGIQVRTGKYRACDEPHPSVTPDAYVDNLAQAVDMIIQHGTL